MEEIAYDIIEHYPLPAKNKEWGEVRMIRSAKMISKVLYLACCLRQRWFCVVERNVSRGCDNIA